MVRRLLLLFIAVALPVTAHAQRPAFAAQPGGIITTALPASILSDAAVKKQLGSGLTTTFLLAVHQRPANTRSAARLEVRYDLWDEIWLVRKIEFDGRSERQRLPSVDALEKWWRAPLRVASAGGDRVTMDVRLSVLPFSAAEGEDARQWISKSGGVATAGAGAGGLVDALIGTTIAAEPITTYRWNVELSLR